MPTFTARQRTVLAVKYNGSNQAVINTAFGAENFFVDLLDNFVAKTPSTNVIVRPSDYVFRPDGFSAVYVMVESDFEAQYE